MTLPQEDNLSKDRFNQIFSTRIQGSDRVEIIQLQNSQIKDIYHAVTPPFIVFLGGTADLYLYNNTFDDVSTGIGSFAVSEARSVVMSNNTFSNSSGYGFSLIEIQYTYGNITIDGLYFDNIQSTDVGVYYTLHVLALGGSSVIVNDFRTTNSDLSLQDLLSIEGASYDLFISDSSIENSKVATGSSMFSIGSARRFNISNISFLNIESSSPDDSDNYMISISNLDLSSSDDSIIQNISVESSTIGFLNFVSIANTPTQPKQFEVMDISISNSQYPIPVEIFNFERISMAEDFTIQMTRIHFESLSFRLGGNLINMQALISNGLVVTDSTASDITGGSMNVEAFNKQNLTIPAKLSKHHF